MNEDYIKYILEEAEIYVTYPKPRGKGGTFNTNKRSEEISKSFNILSKMNRLDIVQDVMSKFADKKDIIKPVPFETWISKMIRELSGNDLIKLFHMNNGFFEKWIDQYCKNSNIIEFAEKIGSVCSKEEFVEFVHFVMERHGKVPGIYHCFHYTTENTQDKFLFNGETIIVTLDFIETINNPDYIATADVHLKMLPLDDETDSIKIESCKVNGILLGNNDYGFYSDEKITPILRSNKNLPFEEFKTGYLKIHNFPDVSASGGSFEFPNLDDIKIQITDSIDKTSADKYAEIQLGLSNGEWIAISPRNSDLNKEHFTIYTDFFEENEIVEITSIELELSFLDEDECIVEKSGIIQIELDYNIGDYIVK